MNKVYGLYDVDRGYLIQSFLNRNWNTKTAMYGSECNAIKGLNSMHSYRNTVTKETVYINDTERKNLKIVRLGIMNEDCVDGEERQ